MNRSYQDSVYIEDNYEEKNKYKKKILRSSYMYKNCFDIMTKLGKKNYINEFYEILEKIFRNEMKFIKKKLFNFLDDFKNIENHLKENLKVFKENLKLFTNILIEDFFKIYVKKIKAIKKRKKFRKNKNK